MESSHELHVLEVIENKFNELLKNPEIYIESQPEKTEDFKQLSKKSYAIAFANNKFKGRCLPQLLIHGFDDEQIWQQSDLLNKEASSNISQIVRSINLQNINLAVSKFQQLEQSTNENIEILKDKEASKNENTDDDAASDGECDKDDQSNESEAENANIAVQESSGGEEDYAFDDDSDSSAEVEKKVKKKSTSQRKTSHIKSEVDDQFFNLSKLDEFLRIEDIKEQRRDEIEPDDEIDYFQDIPSDGCEEIDEESDDDQQKDKKSSKDFMYEDFFDDPESEVGEDNDNSIDENDDDIDENDASLMDQSMKDSFHESDSAVEMKDDSDEKDNEKTAFELEQERTKKKIQECEKSMLEPLPWQLTGEVDASKRPIDSLMDVEADCDTNQKQDVLVDQELTEKIEAITKMAIMNKAFSDVERKYKPTEEQISHKKEVVLDQTKSKKGLAEIYEEDYLKKQSKIEEEEDPKHKEIQKLMDALFPQLHALFSHIPKPAIPDIKIVSNLPAVTVEEVAPTSVSDVMLLAPEEVKKKSGMIKGKTERDETDRKRERRKKKIHQKLKEKKRLEKLESLKSNPSAKITKLEKLDALKKLKQHKNTKIAKVDEGGKIKSSTDFFSRLQDTMDTKKKTNTVDTKKKTKSKVLYKKKNIE